MKGRSSADPKFNNNNNDLNDTFNSKAPLRTLKATVQIQQVRHNKQQMGETEIVRRC